MTCGEYNNRLLFQIERAGKLLYIVCETPTAQSLADFECKVDAILFAHDGKRRPRLNPDCEQDA